MADNKSRDNPAKSKAAATIPAGAIKQQFTDMPPPPDDLVSDPGIGTTPGVMAGNPDPEDIDGESTFEGDVENDPTANGAVDPRQMGRTNK